ncbi:carboxylesterase family protein [Cellvibrio sp. pealriver]|uniref:carboxylesterase family protein n=1 Tax=Cellvibrio sp. pealriver TaxID=1622269 RepID=UPI0018CF8C52|nr:carboxylesterase family protein [Cellvibrio sp. pealriver]
MGKSVVVLVSFFFINLAYADTRILDYRQGVIQQTHSGKVKGYVANQNATLVWKAIPYAQAPLNELRWRAPKPVQPWANTFNANQPSSICPQIKAGQFLGREDCLTLDIYRPNTHKTQLPVMFYIHGGNNQMGDSGEINPEQLVVNANAVVVSINYRVGVLGFNNLPALRSENAQEASGNFGLLDIHQALQWVRHNIRQFGGNPDNITLAGFSAGGRDVMAILVSPLFQGQFQQAISFSGGMTMADYDASTPIIARAIAPLVVEDGVKKDEPSATAWLLSKSSDVRNYLNTVSAERLSQLMTNAGIRMSVFPHLFNDGHVLPKKGFHSDHYNQVPVILFTGSQEFSLFAYWDKHFINRPKETLTNNSSTAKEFAFAKHYGSELYALFNAQAPAQVMLPAYQTPIYIVEFSWGSDPAVAGNAALLFGAYHGVWLPFLTGEIKETATHFKAALQTQGAQLLAQVFTHYVKQFLWTGNPNAEGLVKWEPLQDADNHFQYLSFTADQSRALISMQQAGRSYQQIIADIEADKTLPAQHKQILIQQVLNGRWFSGPLDQHFKNSEVWINVP